jgi:hypothetical protein
MLAPDKRDRIHLPRERFIQHFHTQQSRNRIDSRLIASLSLFERYICRRGLDLLFSSFSLDTK